MLPVRLHGLCPNGCEPCSKHDHVNTGFSLPVASQNFLFESPKHTDFPYNVCMPETLLRTKLFVPRLRANLVPQPHLIEQLHG